MWLSIILMSIYGWRGVVVARRVDMTDHNLAFVPHNITPDVTKLFLDKNQIQEIDTTSFKSYPHLMWLSMKYNSMWKIGENTFGYNPQLTRIYLYYNILIGLPMVLGPSVSIMTQLDLQDAFSLTTDLSGLQEPYFRNFTSLFRLFIGYNNFEPLDASILPRNLQSLYMSACKLTSFPNMSQSTPFLRRLYMNNNYFTVIPRQNIELLSQLMYLYASGNRLSVMPDVSGLFSLLELSLDGNRITTISEGSLKGLKNLRLLSVERNNLHQIPDMSHLVGMKSLSLDDNNLNTIPDLYDLPLTTLTLHGDPLMCNQSLCWIRMLPLMKKILSIDDVRCDYTGQKMMLLIEVHPSYIQCFKGKWVTENHMLIC